jgi:gliding motility-associated-like protein
MQGAGHQMKYVIYRSPDGINYIPNYAVTTDTVFDDKDVVVNDEVWSYKVQAQDACGNKTPLGDEGRNIRLKAEVDGMDIRLIWTAYGQWRTGVDHYTVERYNPETGLWDSLARTGSAMLMHYLPYDNSNLAQYKFRITARQHGGAHQNSVSNYAEAVLPPTLFIPTAFTPNGNGLNETFQVKGLHIASYECEVYDRWGKSIFKTTDMDQPWDGRVDGQLAEQGVFAYRVYAQGYNGHIETRYGTVSILR